MADESGVELKDYKVFCFDGEPKVIEVDFGRFTKHERNLYTPDWQYIPASINYPTNPDKHIVKPDNLGEMLEYAAILSKGMRQVRVDFYIIQNRIYLGEMTLYHEDGCGLFCPDSFNYEMGSWMRVQ